MIDPPQIANLLSAGQHNLNYFVVRKRRNKSVNKKCKVCRQHGDEVLQPENDLDLGKQGETYPPIHFPARPGRYRHQRYGHCSPSPGRHQ